MYITELRSDSNPVIGRWGWRWLGAVLGYLSEPAASLIVHVNPSQLRLSPSSRIIILILFNINSIAMKNESSGSSSAWQGTYTPIEEHSMLVRAPDVDTNHSTLVIIKIPRGAVVIYRGISTAR